MSQMKRHWEEMMERASTRLDKKTAWDVLFEQADIGRGWKVKHTFHTDIGTNPISASANFLPSHTVRTHKYIADFVNDVKLYTIVEFKCPACGNDGHGSLQFNHNPVVKNPDDVGIQEVTCVFPTSVSGVCNHTGPLYGFMDQANRLRMYHAVEQWMVANGALTQPGTQPGSSFPTSHSIVGGFGNPNIQYK